MDVCLQDQKLNSHSKINCITACIAAIKVSASSLVPVWYSECTCTPLSAESLIGLPAQQPMCVYA